MFVARLICSDDDCPERCEIEASTIAELASLACECGCAFEIIGWPIAVQAAELAVVVPLPVRQSWSDAA